MDENKQGKKPSKKIMQTFIQTNFASSELIDNFIFAERSPVRQCEFMTSSSLESMGRDRASGSRRARRSNGKKNGRYYYYFLLVSWKEPRTVRWVKLWTVNRSRRLRIFMSVTFIFWWTILMTLLCPLFGRFELWVQRMGNALARQTPNHTKIVSHCNTETPRIKYFLFLSLCSHGNCTLRRVQFANGKKNVDLSLVMGKNSFRNWLEWQN